jgi:hypothetical protein
LAELDGSANEKIERVALYIREQKALADAAKQERDRLAGIAAARLKAAESLTGYLHREMDRLGKDKVNGVLATIALQKNPLYIEKPEFVRYSPASFALDRKAIIEAHKAGQPIPDGLAVTQTVGLRIR